MIIIDDEYEIRTGLSSYFPWHDLGFEVAAIFEAAPEALEYLGANHIDVVLTDIKMPRMSGLQLARALSEAGRETKVVFVSGYKEFDFLKEALEYRAFDYLLKPVTRLDVARTFGRLKSALDEQRAEKEGAGAPGAPEGPAANIEILKRYIESHYSTTTLEDAAAYMHLNPFYLSRYFKEKTGANFSEFLLRVRMNKAIELMQNRELKTYHISEMVGYRNPNNFSRAFKKLFGQSPKEYRNR
ncbi:MAG TPA: response regulator [Spirochaetia bacterium]|nr:response regulator [Spirochaetia bacterium]